MSESKHPDSALSVDVGPERVSAHVGNEALAGIGEAAAWLMPGWDARVKLTAAMRDCVAGKISRGEPLTDSEQRFVGYVFRVDATAVVQQAEMVQRVEAVSSEVAGYLENTPNADSGTSETFVQRAKVASSEIHEDDLRDLFARVLAGELAKPGAFSVRTLEALRSLDTETAKAFDKVRAMLFSGWLLAPDQAEDAERAAGLTPQAHNDLHSAGLVASTSMLVADNAAREFMCGDRVMRLDTKLLPFHYPYSEVKLRIEDKARDPK